MGRGFALTIFLSLFRAARISPPLQRCSIQVSPSRRLSTKANSTKSEPNPSGATMNGERRGRGRKSEDKSAKLSLDESRKGLLSVGRKKKTKKKKQAEGLKNECDIIVFQDADEPRASRAVVC